MRGFSKACALSSQHRCDERVRRDGAYTIHPAFGHVPLKAGDVLFFWLQCTNYFDAGMPDRGAAIVNIEATD